MITVTFLYPHSEGATFDLDYYRQVHLPLSLRLQGAHLKALQVETGLSGAGPGLPAPYRVICRFTYDSMEAFEAAVFPHQQELVADMPNYTNIRPLVQVSSVEAGALTPMESRNGDPANESAASIAEGFLQQLQEAWNRADGVAFAEPFADACDFVDIRGTLHAAASREAIGAGHAQLFDTLYKGSQIRYRLLDARALPGGLVLAHARADLQTPAGPFVGVSASTITMLLVRNEAGWRIRAFHNTLVVAK